MFDQDRFVSAATTPWVAEHSHRWDHPRPYVVNRWLHGVGVSRDTLCDKRGAKLRFATLQAAERAAAQANGA